MNMSRDSTKTTCGGDTGESPVERRDEGTPTRRLTFQDTAIETPTVVAQTPQTTSLDADVTPTSDSPMSDASPGSRANLVFLDEYKFPDLKTLSSDNREAHLKAIGKATSEACARCGCEDVGEFWAAMSLEDLQAYAEVLLELSKLE